MWWLVMVRLWVELVLVVFVGNDMFFYRGGSGDDDEKTTEFTENTEIFTETTE